jgi:hypothetical protein
MAFHLDVDGLFLARTDVSLLWALGIFMQTFSVAFSNSNNMHLNTARTKSGSHSMLVLSTKCTNENNSIFARAVLRRNAGSGDGVSTRFWQRHDITIASLQLAQSRMFRHFPKPLIRMLATRPLTSNLHHDGVTPEDWYSRPALADFYRVIRHAMPHPRIDWGRSFILGAADLNLIFVIKTLNMAVLKGAIKDFWSDSQQTRIALQRCKPPGPLPASVQHEP